MKTDKIQRNSMKALSSDNVNFRSHDMHTEKILFRVHASIGDLLAEDSNNCTHEEFK